MSVAARTRPGRVNRQRHKMPLFMALVGTLVVVLLLMSSSPRFADSALPVGDLGRDRFGPQGWKQVFVDDFETVGRAGSDGSLAGGRWWGYPDGTPITNSSNGYYRPSQVVSVEDDHLVFRLTSDKQSAYGAVLSPNVTQAQTYGRYDVRYRFTNPTITGFKSAWMLWPDSNRWEDGEIDFAEYREDEANHVLAALHRSCLSAPCPHVDVTRRVDSTAWHTSTAIWSPGSITTYIDGKLLASSRQGVPNQPMHLLLQTQASSYGTTAKPGDNVVIEVDWVTVYQRR